MMEKIEFEVMPEQVEQAISNFLGGSEVTFLGAEVDQTTGSTFFSVRVGSTDEGFDFTQFDTQSVFFESLA